MVICHQTINIRRHPTRKVETVKTPDQKMGTVTIGIHLIADLHLTPNHQEGIVPPAMNVDDLLHFHAHILHLHNVVV